MLDISEQLTDELTGVVAVMVSVSVDGPYSYRVPYGQSVRRGSIVAVPLVGRLTLGVVWGLPKDNFAHNRLKDIAQVYDTPPLSEELLKTVDWVSRYTLAAPGLVLRSVLRSTEALEPERTIIAYRATGVTPDKLTPARAKALDVLMDGEAWAKSAIAAAAGVSTSVIDGLERSGAIARVETLPPPVALRPDPDAAVPKFSDDQASALAQIRGLDPHRFGVALLDGVTGAGKTEVFFEAVADTLRAGRQALVLLPEIALTSSFVSRFTRRFGTKPGEWHSDMSRR